MSCCKNLFGFRKNFYSHLRAEEAEAPFPRGDFIRLIPIGLIFTVAYYLVLVLIPHLLKSLGGSATQIGEVSSFFFLSVVIGRPCSAYFIERVGPATSLLAGSLIMALACVILPLMTTVRAVTWCRSAQGLAFAMVSTAITVLVADRTPAARRGQAFALFGISGNVAAAFGPALGLALLATAGYARTFLIAGISSLICSFFAASFIRRRKGRDASLIRDRNSPACSGNFKRKLIIPSLVIATFGVTYSIHLNFIVVIAGEQGLNDYHAGIYYTFFAAAIVFARLISGLISDRLGRGWLIVSGNLAAGLAMLILGWTHSLTGLLVTATVYGLGAGCVYPAVLTQTVELAPARRRGWAAASFYVACESSIAAAGPLFGWMVTRAGYNWALRIMGVVPLAGALLHLCCSFKPERWGASGLNDYPRLTKNLVA